MSESVSFLCDSNEQLGLEIKSTVHLHSANTPQSPPKPK